MVQTLPVHVAFAAIAATVLLQKRKRIKDIPGALLGNNPNTRKMIIGTGAMYVFEKLLARELRRRGLALPSSLISMVIAFAFFNGWSIVAGDESADRAAGYFAPAVEHLGKWMPLYLVPPLVALPNALGDVGGSITASMWAKMFGVHAGGWIVTLLTTAAVAKSVERSLARRKETSSETDSPVSEHTGGDASAPVEGSTPNPPAVSSAQPDAKAIEAKKLKMRQAWQTITAASFILLPFCGTAPATFSTTVLSLMHGTALPPKFRAVVHPLVTCSAVTAVVAVILGRTSGMTSKGALLQYFTKKGVLEGGPGDLFFSFLSPCCTSLGLRMFYKRRVLFDNLPTLLASTAFSSVLSLFGTTAVCGSVGIAPPMALTLCNRSVMSSLGIPAAQALGGNAPIAVGAILLSGVYGASFGKTILDKVGLTPEHVVTRGVSMGASSHSIGTASFLTEPQELSACAISSVAICLAGVIHTALCVVPSVQNGLRKLAHAI